MHMHVSLSLGCTLQPQAVYLKTLRTQHIWLTAAIATVAASVQYGECEPTTLTTSPVMTREMFVLILVLLESASHTNYNYLESNFNLRHLRNFC
jgi:hypothetical protein